MKLSKYENGEKKQNWQNNFKFSTRRRMARERRGAESSVFSMETLYYKIIYYRCIIGRREE